MYQILQGNSGVGANQHSVTTISWRDAMVWMNALTEYYNDQNSASLTSVYEYTNTVVKDSSNATFYDNVVTVSSADGFVASTIQFSAQTLYGTRFERNQ